MFSIPVGEILSSYTGDSKHFSFSGEVFDGFFSDIHFVKSLEFEITLIALDDGVEVIFEKFETRVIYEDMTHDVHISRFERQWKKHRESHDADDIYEIDSRSMKIDLGPVIREEIIMACHEL